MRTGAAHPVCARITHENSRPGVQPLEQNLRQLSTTERMAPIFGPACFSWENPQTDWNILPVGGLSGCVSREVFRQSTNGQTFSVPGSCRVRWLFR